MSVINTRSGNDANFEDLTEAVQLLPRHQREAVLMHYGAGMSYEQIADCSGVPVSTIKGRLYRARIELKAILEGEDRKDKLMKPDTNLPRILREDISESASTDGYDHVIIYCDVRSDVEVCPADGNEVRINGSKGAVGENDDIAQQAIESISIHMDHIDNFRKEGPHSRVPFTGISSTPWEDMLSRGSAFQESGLFPEIVTRDRGMIERIVGSMGKAVRVTICHSEHIEAHIHRNNLKSEASRMLLTTGWGNEVVSGVSGRVDVVVAVPPGVRVTIIHEDNSPSEETVVRGIHADVHMINCHGVELYDTEGDVLLANSRVRKAERITGNLSMSCYDYDGTEWKDSDCHRWRIHDCSLSSITGTIDVDVAYLNIEVQGISGTASIRNRFGTTRLHLTNDSIGTTFALETDSGKITILAEITAIEQMGFFLATLCGTIEHGALQELPNYHSSNDLQIINVNTVRQMVWPRDRNRDLAADVRVKTRDGNITIERVRS
jgi:hypothetical protein